MRSPAAASAEVLWEASPEDTTATPSIGVPAEADAAVAARAGVEAPGDGIMPAFLGATTTLLRREETNYSFIVTPDRTIVMKMLMVPIRSKTRKTYVHSAAAATATVINPLDWESGLNSHIQTAAKTGK